ncbi:MAG: MerR family transcriptional regulator [Pseudomonadota bacterium]
MMSKCIPTLNPSEAARCLGTTPKALRLWEERGLIAPARTAAGWRAYGADVMARAERIVALRKIGLSLAQIAKIFEGDARDLAAALDAHRAALGGQVREIGLRIEQISTLRADLVTQNGDHRDALDRLIEIGARTGIAFDLPWPWCGERFSLPPLSGLGFITGPLFSGKTRLSRSIAAARSDIEFLGLDRMDQAHPATSDEGPVMEALRWLEEDGATRSAALSTLLAAILSRSHGALVIDMVEEGLDAPSQEALIAWIRRRGADARPLVLLTRSSSILDLDAVMPGEMVLFCPPNHAPPIEVTPHPGAAGYEAVATCLATPEVRARTKGVIAVRSGERERTC